MNGKLAKKPKQKKFGKITNKTSYCICGHLDTDHRESGCAGLSVVHDDGRASYCPCRGFRPVKSRGSMSGEGAMSQGLADELRETMQRMMVEGAPTSLLREILQKDPEDTLVKNELNRREKIQLLQATPGAVESPEIVVEQDYDDYFLRLVQNWIGEQRKRGLKSRHQKIVVEACPYNSTAVSARSDGETTLHLEFYAALRTGFGRLTERDVEALITKWI